MAKHTSKNQNSSPANVTENVTENTVKPTENIIENTENVTEKKGGKSKKKPETKQEEAKVEETKVEETKVEEAKADAKEPKQKGGKAKGKKNDPVEGEVIQEAATSEPKQKGGRKKADAKLKNESTETKAKAPKKVAKVKAQSTKTESNENDETEPDDKDNSRSFKVKLPNNEEYTGRFTGLTPYQAANKALSKFFRTNENNIDNDQVIFTIKESTRNSKRHEYTYKGSRIKLNEPITYTIKSANGEDRVITKQYKNQLTKIKKSNNATETAPASA